MHPTAHRGAARSAVSAYAIWLREQQREFHRGEFQPELLWPRRPNQKQEQGEEATHWPIISPSGHDPPRPAGGEGRGAIRIRVDHAKRL